ncbi:lipid-binding SYLF domain-containing protein [Aliarcobacter cryaerophilus]|uniref:lipid-binding SYLF domain-containing protein n=1 Tax=Aliarcobacter cryaerophilus TaxID=28198 RepID=UPI0008265838|nr:hypothetical protein [Aliarcobacter cryaerophilus]
MLKILKLLAIVYASFMLISCSSKTANEKIQERESILKDSRETLELLYKHAPEAKEMIKNAYGYATFNDFGMNDTIINTENGKGVAHSNHTKKNTYMKMFAGGLGFGIGIKDFRAIFIFENEKVFKDFVEKGWETEAEGDIAAKYKKDGTSLNIDKNVKQGIIVYKLTKSGLIASATLQATKFWKYSDLN